MITLSLLRRAACCVLPLLLAPMLVFGQTSENTPATDKNKKSGNPFTAVAAARGFPFAPLAKDQPYGDPSLPPEERAAAVVKAMTLEEKLNSAGGFQRFYSPQIERLGLRPLYFSDASQGVHIREELNTGLEKSTAFPCTLALAATWNPELAGLYARSIGEECRAGDIAVLLGPGMNIYRDSECGRNFEYMGEDPLLAGRMVAAYVTALQKTGTMATLKHFFGNNSEYLRFTSDSVIGERAIREIYTPAFKAGIDAGAGAVMTSYNLVNGEWVGHSPALVDTLLRKELGFHGLAMSDWGAIRNSRKFMTCQEDLCMPAFKELNLSAMLKEGQFSEKDLDGKIQRWLTAFFKMGFYDRPQKDPSMPAKFPEHQAAALRTAQESIVLLSNPKNLLPLNPSGYKHILLTGNAAQRVYSNPAAKQAADQGLHGGGGSGSVIGYNWVSLEEALKKEFGDRLTFSQQPADSDIQAADLVIVAVATTDSEGKNRPFTLTPEGGAGLAARCAALNPNTVLVSMVGGGYDLTDCYDKVAAHLFSLFLGQVQGTAIVDVLMGRINPSGKLPFTIEKQYADSPAAVYPAVNLPEQLPDAPGKEACRVEYKEGVFVGYRWYEHQKIEPLYPFGFGLSYTTFGYDQLKLSANQLKGTDALKVSFRLTNKGSREGAETAQLYVRDVESSVERPVKELKGFQKVMLKPGETKTVELTLSKKDLSFWDEKTHAWKAEDGAFEILVGSSSVNLPLKASFNYKN